MAKFIKKATKSPLFLFIAGLVIVAGVGFLVIPHLTKAGDGRIWTTKNDCGVFNQDVNHYNVDEWVWVNGEGFAANTSYDWNIKGKPGGASSDPNQTVAQDSYTTDANGAFCFQAYQVGSDGDTDWGEYTVELGNKKDNYRVGTTGSITVRKESINDCFGGWFDFWIYDEQNAQVAYIEDLVGADNIFGDREKTIESLSEGEYRIKERETSLYTTSISCTDGQSDIAGRTVTVDLSVGENITCTFTNTANYGHLMIKKVNSQDTNELLGGACYRLTYPSGTTSDFCDNVGDNDSTPGKTLLYQLPAGNYTLQELSAPTGYQVNSTEYPITITAPSSAESCVTTIQIIPNDPVLPICGNDIKETGEECDNGQDNGVMCTPTYGGQDCTYCNASCEERTVEAPFCGNLITESAYEECDGDNPLSCEINGYQGWIQCQNDCSWTECIQEDFCGDGDVNGPEDCDDGNNVDGDGCSAQCTLEPSHLYGRKVNDKNNSGTQNTTDAYMNNWVIRLYDSNWNQVGIDHLTGETGTKGQYHFEIDTLGIYYVCEVLQPGWIQTWPSTHANLSGEADEALYCRKVDVTAYGTDYASKTFGNYYPECGNDVIDQGEECGEPGLTTPDHYACNQCLLEYVPYCGDGNTDTNEACDDGNTNDDDTCKNDCTINTHTCGNGILQTDLGEVCDDGANNGVACIADYDKTCTYCSAACAIVTVTGPSTVTATPVITLAKMDTPDPIAAGADLTYTLNFTISNAPVTGLVMTDEIPANTTFISASDPGVYDATTNKVTWDYGTLVAGNYVATLKVTVYSPLANGTKISNTAIIDSNETDPAVTATAETTTSTAPILTMDKLVDNASPLAGDTINYTVKITNSGTDAATNVKLTDTLPAGLTFVDNGTTTMTYSFGNIESGKTVATTYAVKIDSAIAAGTYTNSAVVTADNHADLTDSVDVAVSVPIVLGEETEEPAPEVKVLGEELPETGANILFTILSGLALVGSGFILRRKAQ